MGGPVWVLRVLSRALSVRRQRPSRRATRRRTRSSLCRTCRRRRLQRCWRCCSSSTAATWRRAWWRPGRASPLWSLRTRTRRRSPCRGCRASKLPPPMRSPSPTPTDEHSAGSAGAVLWGVPSGPGLLCGVGGFQNGTTCWVDNVAVRSLQSLISTP